MTILLIKLLGILAGGVVCLVGLALAWEFFQKPMVFPGFEDESYDDDGHVARRLQDYRKSLQAAAALGQDKTR